jgi:AbrB family looped-hinge helix DNA binding protein
MEVKMAYSSSISSKGQITIPQEVRNRLGLSTGDRVEFVVEGDRTILRPMRPTSNPFARQAGILGTFPGGAEEINAWLRELRDPSDESEHQ